MIPQAVQPQAMQTSTASSASSTPPESGRLEQAWNNVANECPLRLSNVMHRYGTFIHVCSDRVSGKVLCCHRNSTEMINNHRPTKAQKAAEEEGKDG